MSERARDVVRYLQSVERGALLRIDRSHGFEWPVWNPDYQHAWMLDVFDPVENALAAIRRFEHAWQTFPADYARYIRQR